MTNQQSFWTIRQADGWGVKRQGTRQPSSVHDRQMDAWKEARRLSGSTQGEPRLATRGRSNPAPVFQLKSRSAHKR